ncbi:GNAT family N-acetyltransferase [Streptomyces sp. B1866]|uniref:GNAT family N-acetyltransferase n=1 Tax=Streptomyces sp. B1866 TaxID=3075431 RepID=UPI00288E91A6|nr:GNAT family N-acetyltransferase [Streptomyces sp. B1866]MDT3397789.1 GNAT family N-acetyltransferase [Streptomyces sp. B1866]
MHFTAGGRFEVRITAADVGKRVSVRLAIEGGGGPERFTDVVGVLTSWTGGVLRVTRRTGQEVRIAESSLVAGKVVPAAPARRRGPAAGVAELERVASRGWPAVERARLGGWELRAASGFTRRANSALAVGDPGLPLDDALERVARWYAERGLPAYVQAPGPAPRGGTPGDDPLAARLTALGWAREVSAEVRTAALAPLADRDADTPRVTLARHADAAWLARYGRVGGLGPRARAVLEGGPSVWFATIRAEIADTDSTTDASAAGTSAAAARTTTPEAGAEAAHAAGAAAIGRLVVDGRWAGFAAIEVAPDSRRRGLATAVTAALARQALTEGASAAYLQVETDNQAARALYDGMGFTVHHTYHHWRR